MICALLIAVTALTLARPVQAQSSTGSTVALERVTLRSIEFRGNGAIGDAELQALAAPYLGQSVALADLDKLAAAVTQLYRDRGYFLAIAVVPQQAIADGKVQISVLEGRLGKVDVRVAADAPVKASTIEAIVGRLKRGTALQVGTYERVMLLMSDLPGVRVQAGLEQGAETGTTDLVVEVAAAPRRWDASVDLDNYGTEASGRWRASASVRYASPFGVGDNLDARLMSTSNAGQTFGRLAYEAPLGQNGLRAGIGASRVGYELGGQYEALGASGTAVVFDTSLSYPLIRSRALNLLWRASYESKQLRDETQQVGLDTHKHVDALSNIFNWESRDALWGGGYTSAGVTFYLARLRFDDDVSLSNDQSDIGRHTAGNFTKLNLQAGRLQTLFGRNNLFVSLNGQFASRNLDASEKLALGGDGAVRAYPSGEVLVDVGYVGSVEWRYSASDDVVLSAFYDLAEGRQAKAPGPVDASNSRQLRGGGVGVTWQAPYKITLRAAAAWRGAGPSTSDGGASNPRLSVQLQKAF